MRPLRFRAWDELNKVMHQDVQFIRSGTEGNDWILFVSDKRPLNADSLSPLNDPFFSRQIKVMQFTNLHDRHGKEIYESDILHYEMDAERKYLWVVEFKDGCFIRQRMTEWGYRELNDRLDQFEVIGNIHANPELVKG